MSCKECGCNRAAERSLAEETSQLTLSEKNDSGCACSAKVAAKSCCSSGCSSGCCPPSRPSRGCACCCRSCCACCKCCSGSSRDFCQERTNEARPASCKCCGSKKEEVVRQAGCGCKH